MRKINLLKGLNAKSALAVAIVAGFTLAGCEKEDFNVNVPDINVTVPDPVIKNGVAEVVLNAESASGNMLRDVVFTDAAGTVLTSPVRYEALTSTATLTVTATKDGYATVVKTVSIPPLPQNAYVVIPVNFVLSAIEDPVQVTAGEKKDVPSVPDSEDKTYTGTFAANVEYTFEAVAFTGTYYTAAQKTALLAKIAALTGPTTRAGEEDAANLAIAKKDLADMINALPTEPATKPITVTVTVDEPAKSVILTTTFTSDTYGVTFATNVAGQTYAVDGEQLQVVENIVVPGAEGITVEHGHGHGHGNGGNAGGGTGGK